MLQRFLYNGSIYRKETKQTLVAFLWAAYPTNTFWTEPRPIPEEKWKFGRDNFARQLHMSALGLLAPILAQHFAWQCFIAMQNTFVSQIL